jgi:hypothetical protein
MIFANQLKRGQLLTWKGGSISRFYIVIDSSGWEHIYNISKNIFIGKHTAESYTWTVIK